MKLDGSVDRRADTVDDPRRFVRTGAVGQREQSPLRQRTPPRPRPETTARATELVRGTHSSLTPSWRHGAKSSETAERNQGGWPVPPRPRPENGGSVEAPSSGDDDRGPRDSLGRRAVHEPRDDDVVDAGLRIAMAERPAGRCWNPRTRPAVQRDRVRPARSVAKEQAEAEGTDRMPGGEAQPELDGGAARDVLGGDLQADLEPNTGLGGARRPDRVAHYSGGSRPRRCRGCDGDRTKDRVGSARWRTRRYPSPATVIARRGPLSGGRPPPSRRRRGACRDSVAADPSGRRRGDENRSGARRQATTVRGTCHCGHTHGPAPAIPAPIHASV